MTTESDDARSALRIAIAGALSLAVAMGIGRFAFTPLMPIMLQEGLLDIAAASWLASANYLGYLVGALLCTFQPALWARWSWPTLPSSTMVKVGLTLTCALTAAMAIDITAAWPGLRFITGITTAIGFVYTSTWCLAHLARLHRPTAGGIVYMGPGIGIACSGLLASVMVQVAWPASWGWIAFGVLALIITVLVWPVFRHDDGLQKTSVAHAVTDSGGTQTEKATLVIAYGLAGFGYIITATFLPVMARAALPGSVWLDLFWPLLGIAVACGALLASRIPARIDQRRLLLGCYLMQSLGVVIVNWVPTLTGFAIGSVLVGLPFTAITFFAMQLGRQLHPQSAPAIIGLLSGAFAFGQIIGPPVAAAMLARASNHATGFAWAIDVAAISLLLGAGLYGWMIKRFSAVSTTPATK
ncbi:MAG: YbfB/YjiJ family MFS transporter [Burkholderiaceae bacterium]|jgi:MFS family permease|nr:YbfB/YjiJ family MFS transporter [Oxalobacteraceae bacterium]